MLRLQYQKELVASHVTIQTKFNYAWGLVKSPMREHQVEGVRLLQGMYYCSRYEDVNLSGSQQKYIVLNLPGDESVCTTWHWDITRWAITKRQRSSTVRHASRELGLL